MKSDLNQKIEAKEDAKEDKEEIQTTNNRNDKHVNSNEFWHVLLEITLMFALILVSVLLIYSIIKYRSVLKKLKYHRRYVCNSGEQCQCEIQQQTEEEDERQIHTCDCKNEDVSFVKGSNYNSVSSNGQISDEVKDAWISSGYQSAASNKCLVHNNVEGNTQSQLHATDGCMHSHKTIYLNPCNHDMYECNCIVAKPLRKCYSVDDEITQIKMLNNLSGETYR